MKKTIALFCIIAIQMLTGKIAFAQNSNFRRDSVYQLLKQAQTPAGQVTAWAEIAEHYGKAGQPDSLKYATGQMLKIASATHQDSLLAKTYLQIGSYFGNISDYRQALEYQFKSLSFAEKAKSNYDTWLASKEVGSSFKHLKNYSEALRYLKKSEPFLKDEYLSKQNTASRTYSHIAEIFLGLAQPDSALRCVQLTNEVTSKEKDTYGYARVLYIFASVYKEKAILTLQKVIIKNVSLLVMLKTSICLM